jgi:hypothetical protein
MDDHTRRHAPSSRAPSATTICPASTDLYTPMTNRDVTADVCFTRAGPHHIGIGTSPRRASQWTAPADRRTASVPVHATIGGLVDPAGCGAHVVRGRITGYPGCRGKTIALGPDEAPRKRPIDIRCDHRRRRWHGASGASTLRPRRCSLECHDEHGGQRGGKTNGERRVRADGGSERARHAGAPTVRGRVANLDKVQRVRATA